MELYLIRHGQSTNNQNHLPDVADPPLTELGKEQSRRAGESLIEKGITWLYCSPMLRALQSAQIIGDILNLRANVFIGLHEWGGLSDENEAGQRTEIPGLTRSEMEKICPQVVLPASVTDSGWWFHKWKDAEMMTELARENSVSFVRYLQTHHADTDEGVIAILHGGSGSNLLCALLGLPFRVGYAPFHHNNTGVSRIRITPELTHVRYLNRVDHLSEEAVT